LKVLGPLEKDLEELPDDPADLAAIEAAGESVVSVVKDDLTGNVTSVRACGRDDTEPRKWMAHLKGLPRLEWIDLPNYITTDADMVLLRDLKSVRVFQVCGGEFGSEGLRAVGTLTNLKELKLTSVTSLNSETASFLTGLSNLERLDLTSTSIGDDGLHFLVDMKNLKSLTLNFTNITDRGLVHLRNMTSLEEIYLGNTAVTDVGLDNFRGLKKLRSLSGKLFTRDALLRLKQDLPKLIVLPEFEPRVPK